MVLKGQGGQGRAGDQVPPVWAETEFMKLEPVFETQRPSVELIRNLVELFLWCCMTNIRIRSQSLIASKEKKKCLSE